MSRSIRRERATRSWRNLPLSFPTYPSLVVSHSLCTSHALMPRDYTTVDAGLEPPSSRSTKTCAHLLSASSSSTVAQLHPAHRILRFASTRNTYPTCLFSIPSGPRRYSSDW